jgi:hypothetical protein
MRIRSVAVLALMALAFTSACGGTDGGPDSTSEPTAVETTEASPPTPAAPESYALGDRVDFTADGEFNVTLLDYRKDQPDDDSVEDGERLDVLLVKACNVSTDDDPNDSDLGSILAFENIQLADADDGSYSELDLAPSPAPKPQLDTFKVLGQGQCHKGWLAFAVPEDTKMTSANHSADGENLARWNL